MPEALTEYFGKATADFILAHKDEDCAELALKSHAKGIDIIAATQQISGMKTAKSKLPSFAVNEGIVYPPKISMEQCSSELTAEYKRRVAERVCEERRTVCDLTGGFGIDLYHISKGFERRVYVERREELCRIARHNFKQLDDKQTDIHNEDAEKFLYATAEDETYDLIFIDPARRDSAGKKTVMIEDCEPNLIELQDTLLRKAKRVMVKLSPMLDTNEAVRRLKEVKEVHIVSLVGECKEVLIVMGGKGEGETRYFCTNIAQSGEEDVFSYTESEAKQPVNGYCDPMEYIYEPNASVMKGQAFGKLCAETGTKKIAPNSHLFTSSTKCDGFPGRTFIITNTFTLNKKETKNALKDIERANVSVRNFPMAAEELRKRLKLKDGGEDYIIGTTLSDGRHICLLCKKA